MGTVLVIDLGTTYFKASAFDLTGDTIGVVRLPVPVERPEPGRTELPVTSLQQQIEKLFRQLERESPGSVSRASALTFSTQTNSFVLLSRTDMPLTPLILWPDDRARNLSCELDALTGLDTFRSTTGVPLLTHEFMAAKVCWFRQCAPAIFRQTARIDLISDYMTFWMTGRHVTEAGVAGLTGLLNIETLQWWPDACRQLELPRSWFSSVVRAGTDLGPILPAITERLGLPGRCRFVVGCLDQYAGAMGAANVTTGGVSETTGTVLATVRCADRFYVDSARDVFQGPAFEQGVYYQMIFGDTSANLLEAYRNSLPDQPDFDALDRDAARIGPGADGLQLTRTDQAAISDGRCRKWQKAYGRGHAVRAILETVAFALADQVEQLCGQNVPAVIGCVGGAARSALWLQIKADVLNRTVMAVDCTEPTSLGAALLALRAMTGAGIRTLASSIPRRNVVATPNEERHRIYARLRSENVF